MPVADGLQEDGRRVQAQVLLHLPQQTREQVDARLGPAQRDPLLVDGHGVVIIGVKRNLETVDK